MDPKLLFDQFSIKSSKSITNTYSTSFSFGIRFLGKELQDAIYSIYGFVRIADEIVDSFHEYDKQTLLSEFREETKLAIERGISTNPVLNSFQKVVNQYDIPQELIGAFLDSMEMDLSPTEYNPQSYKQYIFGSAEVVGLMCLKVFVYGDASQYEKLKENAMALGSAFQKINFLRDIQADYITLGRTYFPGVDVTKLNRETKKKIETEILVDFQKGMEGIRQLPRSSRLGVYVAYIYYVSLFRKIQNVAPEDVLHKRVRISNNKKIALFASSYLRHSLNLL